MCTRTDFKDEFIIKQITHASMMSTYSLSGDSVYLALLIKKRNVRLKITCNMSFYTEENRCSKYFIMSNASNSLSPQMLLQYVAAIPKYISCTVFLGNAD